MRPRDAIAYLNECFVLAGGRLRLSWNDIQRAERPYSINRLSALRDEWKATYPAIDELFAKFKHSTSPMRRDDITKLLDESVLLLAQADFPGEPWMSELSEPIWKNTATAWIDMYYPLLRLLFNLGFIGCSSETGQPIYIHENPEYGEQAGNFESAIKFYVHPAFRSALEIETLASTQRRSTSG